MEIKRNREGKSKEKQLKTGLKGKTVMISGASRNIGKQTAILMAEEGANLVLCTQKSIEPLQETAHELEELGANVIAELCDVTNQDQVNKFVTKAADKFGSVDVLINNAVFRSQHAVLETIDEEWDRNIEVNLTGPFKTTRAVLPHMIKNNWGRIINYSGIAPYLGAGAAKAMVKLGIVGYTRGLAREVGKNNITANCIGPGSIDVERDAGLGDVGTRIHETLGIPAGRQGTPEEIASLAVYLSSELAGYITGQCYLANGGAYFQ